MILKAGDNLGSDVPIPIDASGEQVQGGRVGVACDDIIVNCETHQNPDFEIGPVAQKHLRSALVPRKACTDGSGTGNSSSNKEIAKLAPVSNNQSASIS